MPSGSDSVTQPAGLAASLLFAPGERPSGSAVRTLAQEGIAQEGQGVGFAVTLDPAKSANDDRGNAGADGSQWLELLVNGLAFDLAGLAPGPAASPPPSPAAPGLAGDLTGADLEAILLHPAPHLVGADAMRPVSRSIALLAALLADLPGLRCIAWHPARCWSPPAHFRDSVLRWCEGGVFPGLSLASLVQQDGGSIESAGLALFTGQELWLEPDLAREPAAGARLALRLMHFLVELGGLPQSDRLTMRSGEALRLELTHDGTRVEVRRD